MTSIPDGYSGWVLTDRDAVLAALAELGVHPVHPVLDCEHITRAYPDTRPAPEVTTVRLIGVAADDRVQALVAVVDGTTIRPDGRSYHVTYSLAQDAEPVESNDLLARPQDVDLFPPLTVSVAAFLRDIEW